MGILHFIYKTTCIVTGRYYIGMHSSKKKNDRYLGSGSELKKSLKEYGRLNHTFEIIEYLPDRASLSNREREIVNEKLLVDNLCMNMILGGEGELCSADYTIKSRISGGFATIHSIIAIHQNMLKTDVNYKKRWTDSISLSQQGEKNSFFGKKHKPETIELISKIKKGTGCGSNNSQFNTCWIYYGTISKKIKKSELEWYLQLGWIKGRKMK